MTPSLAMAGELVAAPSAPSRVKTINRDALKDWWDDILKEHGRYQCYAVFLVLPTDQNAVQYMANRACMSELDLITQKYCLALTASKHAIRRVNLDPGMVGIYKTVRRKHQQLDANSYCLTFTRIFHITYEQLPCLVLFRDLRCPTHVYVSLKDLAAGEIAQNMRQIFTVVNNAIDNNRDPLRAVNMHMLNRRRAAQQNALLTQMRTFAGKTFEHAVNTWLQALLNRY